MKHPRNLLSVEAIFLCDLDLVRRMNPHENLDRPFYSWPEWAQRDAQLVANYRRQFSAIDVTLD